MNELNIETLAKEVRDLRDEIKEWQDVLKKNMLQNTLSNDKWMSINDLIEYLPDKTARATIYGWVSQGLIPYHKYGKKLTFLKSEIDNWLYYNAGSASDLFEFPQKKIQHFR
ncbi:MAG: helix-turn-helix domain-containing protein [Bacteroidales bacterium]|nr:helix-turn-helix domain-containing protein [Bacteroidales bacterium]